MPSPTETRTATKSASNQSWALSDASPVAQLSVDRNGAVRGVNAAAIELLATISDYLPGDPAKLVGEPVDVLPFGKSSAEAGRTVHNIGERSLQVTVIPQADGQLLVLDDISNGVAKDDELIKLRAMLEQVPTNVMLVDRDLNLTYLNKKSIEALTSLQEYLPVPVSELIGTSIDIFHKNPAHQRGLLGSTANLPHKAIIALGPEKMELSISAIHDASGEYVAAMATWDIVTERLEFESNIKGQLDAISKAQAVIEFNPDGTIITANDNFLGALGYSLGEIQGQHHRMFVESDYAASPAYAALWNSLRAGQYQAGEFKRLKKDGSEIWIQASYNPIVDVDGNTFKVVKYATDITEMVASRADFAGQLAAISKSQAVIEFNVDGTIIIANQNFLVTLGYSLGEIQGQHHRMFVEPAYATSAEYSAFWASLRAGEYQAGEFKRIGKQGQEIFIQASYNPILDEEGRVMKVVKYATDVTAAVAARTRLETGIVDMLAVVEQLVSSSAQLGSVSLEMGSSAEESAAQANVVAAAAEEVSANVSTVASATEQMTASIREIASNSSNAASVAERAVEVAQDTNATAAKLGESSTEIGQIVKVITSIAQQTNLLALNATIEAARAGEVGKGFAVVANEVKELAKATARATEDISQKIEAIQTDTGSVVTAIDDISGIIGQISDIQSTIASAVEEQAATTSEIGRNVTEAARGSSEIAENITSVAEAAANTSTGAAQTSLSATEMGAIADRLRELISGLTS